MKGVVLAGGTGTRLRPITHTLPKQLIPIANKPVLEYIVEDLVAAGVTEIGIVLGNRFREEIQFTLGDGSKYGANLTYIVQGEPLGLAHAVGCARPFVGDEGFVVYFGDTIIEPEITSKLVSGFEAGDQDVGIVLQEVDKPSRYGIAEFYDDELVGLHEKPEDPPSEFAYIGEMALSSAFFRILSEVTPSWRGELELTQAVDTFIRQYGNATTLIEPGIWKDVGTPKDVIETNRLLLERLDSDICGNVHPSAEINGTVIVEENSKLGADVQVTGPVIIGEGTTITEGTELGPNVSVGDECTIGISEIQSSVIFDRVELRGSGTVTRSIIPKECVVKQQDNQSQSFIIDRDSQINY